MSAINSTPLRQQRGDSPLVGELRGVFDVLDDQPIIETLLAYRWTGRKGWDLRALWRSRVAAHIMNVGTTNDLVRRLQDNSDFRAACGFGDQLPSRWTFNRFYNRLARHRDLVERCLARLTDRLSDLLPGFGKHVAVDSTVVRSHSNPDKPVISDPEASWTAKQGTQGRKAWFWGYKLHLAADTAHELPISFTVTTAKRQDTQEFVPVIDRARLNHLWFQPETISADAGYDADANYEHVKALRASPVIKAKSLRTHFEVDDPALPRSSGDWTATYNMRQAVERLFSRAKGHRALNSHCRRGLATVSLHCAMSLLSLQATATAAVLAGQTGSAAACTRRVA